MNLAFLIIIVFALLISTFASVLIQKNRRNKWFSLFSAFCINTIILVVATWFLYSFNDKAKLFGFGQSGLNTLIFSIPLITYINFVILESVRYIEKRTKK